MPRRLSRAFPAVALGLSLTAPAADDGAPGPQLDTETLFLELMGADTLGWLRFGTHRISARLQPRRARGIDGPMRLALDLAHACIFDRTCEQRL